MVWTFVCEVDWTSVGPSLVSSRWSCLRVIGSTIDERWTASYGRFAMDFYIGKVISFEMAWHEGWRKA